MYTRDTEIRHLTALDVLKLSNLLDQTNSWKDLMQVIPRDLNSTSSQETVCKYNYDDIRLVENASIKQNRNATEILLDEWGTSGKTRPTVGVLLELLVRAKHFRAADLVAKDFLNEPIPARGLTGPERKIEISFPLDSERLDSIEAKLNEGDPNFPGTETLNDNARPRSLAENNIDYYEKYHPNDKRVDIPPPSPQSPPPTPMSNASRPSTDNGVVTPEPPVPSTSSATAEQPQTDFIKFSSTSITESQAIPVLSELIPPNASSISQGINLPMLSALYTPQPSESDSLPNISALHVDDNEPDDDKLKVPEESSSMLSSSSVSSLSSTADEDELSAPNLSILDQRSSNNDSSLTNVTGTSEENSFEMSINEGSTSNDNIPCLSALK